MRFTIPSSMALMTGLSSAFVMTTYSGAGCWGSTQNVNVWDNTCAAWPAGFRSFRITTWGGNHQKAYFFAPDNCGNFASSIASGYVDSTTYDYNMNGCNSFDGTVVNAVASYSTVSRPGSGCFSG